MSATPLSVFLPFNRDVLGQTFEPAKAGGAVPPRSGRWLLVQEQNLVVSGAADDPRVPSGALPAALAPDVALPADFRRETMVPMRGTKLSDSLLSLGGMAMQGLWWQSTSGYCPRCGEATDRIEGEWGKRCPGCKYEHYPHLHPAVITLVRDGDRFLLARKQEWAPGRYALVAGFVDNGESFEGAVAREVKEEVGVDVTDIEYVGSQNWPFPSQIMVGFVARYAGGDVRVDSQELEDARWFTRETIPISPSRHSIAGFIIRTFALGG